MSWEPYEKWSQADKDKFNKDAERINKAWGEKNERERREKVANALGFEKETKQSFYRSGGAPLKVDYGLPKFEKDKSKVNSEASTSKNQSSSSKSQKM